MCSETKIGYLEIFEKISPILLIVIGYYLGNRGKKVDVDIQKIKELNVVLSNMLDTWHYLNKLSELLHFQDEKNNNLIFSKEYLPFISLRSGVLNDSCFVELEESITSLKQYDPIIYFELEGVGKKFDFIRTNYIMPFLKSSQKGNLQSTKISRVFLDNLLNDIEQNLRDTAKQISKKTYQKIEDKIEISFNNYEEKLKEDYNYEYYEIILSILPDNVEKPSFEKFMSDLKDPEIQQEMSKQFDLIAKKGMDKVISLMIENPDLSMDEIEQMLIANDK